MNACSTSVGCTETAGSPGSNAGQSSQIQEDKEDVAHRLLTSMLPMHLYMQGRTHIHTAKKKTEKPETFI